MNRTLTNLRRSLTVAAIALFAGLTIAGCSKRDEAPPAVSAPAAPATPAAPAPAAAAEYTCPMHPKVHSDKPGKCPECGMALVAGQADPHNH